MIEDGKLVFHKSYFDESCFKMPVHDSEIVLCNRKISTYLKELRREEKELRVLILSARSEVDDRIAGLDTGANDYLVKPFHFDKLEARIRSLLPRRFVQDNVLLACGRDGGD